MRGNSHVRFGAGDEETCLGDEARRFIPTLPADPAELSLSIERRQPGAGGNEPLACGLAPHPGMARSNGKAFWGLAHKLTGLLRDIAGDDEKVEGGHGGFRQAGTREGLWLCWTVFSGEDRYAAGELAKRNIDRRGSLGGKAGAAQMRGPQKRLWLAAFLTDLARPDEMEVEGVEVAEAGRGCLPQTPKSHSICGGTNSGRTIDNLVIRGGKWPIRGRVSPQDALIFLSMIGHVTPGRRFAATKKRTPPPNGLQADAKSAQIGHWW